MRTAEEVRQIKREVSEAILNKIERMIVSAQAEGSTEIWWYTKLGTGEMDVLRSAGYKLKEQWDRNDYMMNISWAS